MLLVAGLLWGTHGFAFEMKGSGTDNDACLNGSESCRTFGWALRAFNSTTLRENLTIEVYYSHDFTNASGTHILNSYLEETLSLPQYVNSSDHWPFGRGGGLSIFLLGRSDHMNIDITHTQFDTNWAQEGGGMYLQLYPWPSNNNIYLESCTFQANHANETGGGLSLGLLHSAVHSDDFNTIQISYTHFLGNFATKWGGGLSSSTNGLRFKFELVFSYCMWKGNVVQISAAALGLTHWFDESYHFVMIPLCYSCKFYSNHLRLVHSASHQYVYSIVVLQGVPMVFKDNMEFVNNSASALLVSSSFAVLHRNVLFQGKSALSGGGVHLMGSSWLILVQGLNLTIENNVAFQYGGGIYYVFPPSLSVKNSHTCFLQYESHRPVNVSEWNITVTFRNNVASQAGDAIYISTADECIWEMGDNPFQFNSHTPFHYEQNNTGTVIATSPKSMSLNLSQVKRDNYMWYIHSVMPGHSVNIQINVTDNFNHMAVAVVSIRCHNISSYLQYEYSKDLCDGAPYTLLHSQRVFTIESSLSGLQFSGPTNSEFLLVMKTNDLQPLILPVLIKVTHCNLGYIYKNGTCECYSHNSSHHIQCVQDTPCLQQGYWFGQIGYEETGEVIYGIQTCPVGSCSGKCHQCADLSKETWCSLSANESHFCQHLRSGPLCSTCEGTYSLSYDAYECVKCTSTKIIVFALICVCFWIVMIQCVVLLHYHSLHCVEQRC